MSRSWPDLAVLALLVGVDDLGSLGAAARRECMAQPNASRAVRRLEGELGVTLLRRGARGSVLTPQGTVLVHWAREVLADAGRLLDAAEALRGARRDELAVSASMTVAEHLVPAWLGELRRHRPGLRIHLLVHNSTTVFEQVETGACDVGFVESPSVPRGLHSCTVGQDRLVVVVTPAHPWARRRRPLRPDELAATPLVVRESGSGTRTTLDDALRDLPRAEPLLELASGAAVRASVLAGVGPAVVSVLAVREQVAAGTLRVVEVEGLALTRRLRAVWREPRRLTGPAAELVATARRLDTSVSP
ncbi:LysR family transcriptional regulator [Terrabacter aerolatus]|uniref:LysR family transcriptional regulator n=1 Tax=Terrabacter aerolatus TaxID=422442 RepID=A0A512CVV5_9MICO|nr:LysR family transcriptional regulator [Terrabacter aerolatus]GEO28368.1 LysR family transcriptional regulator [Terrabacter aerolatus]